MTTPEAALAAALHKIGLGCLRPIEASRDVCVPGTRPGSIHDGAPEALTAALHDAGYALTPLAPEAAPRRDGLRERIGDLDREPTLDEIAKYGLDGSPGTAFNTLQWKLDRVRDALAATRTPEPPDSGDRADILQAATGGPDFTVKEWPPRDAGIDAALERLMTAVGNYFVVSYRYAHGTGGGATDEKMDATTAAMLDAYQAAARLRSGSPAPEGGE